MALIVLADDGSAIARQAHVRAVELFGRDHSYLALAVVAPAHLPGAPLSPMDAAHVTIPDPESEIATENMERTNLDATLREGVEALGITATTRVEMGDPATVICDVARETGAKAIVVGSHGHGLLTRVLMGSVSTQVLHGAPCPVLVVPRDS